MYLPPYLRDIHGTAFPPTPIERELFYRDDLHIWYIYNGTVWVDLQAPGMVPHHLTHEDGGADEISVAGLSGLLADPQTPLGHHLTHEDGGADEVDVTGLSGLLADPQTALPHAAQHEDGGADEINVGGLSGLLADPQTPLPHGATHEDGGVDEINVGGLPGLLADPQTPLGHHGSHELGGADQVMGTVPATPLALIHRDAAGRSQIVNPAVNADIDNLGARNAAIAAHKADVDAHFGLVPIFHVHKNFTHQLIISNTWTKVTWVTEVYDIHGCFDLANNRFLPTKAGKYLLIGAFGINALVADKRMATAIFKNGNLEAYMGQPHSSHAVHVQCAGSALVEANGSTDYFEMYAWHNSGINRDISGHTASTIFQGFRIIEDS